MSPAAQFSTGESTPKRFDCQRSARVPMNERVTICANDRQVGEAAHPRRTRRRELPAMVHLQDSHSGSVEDLREVFLTRLTDAAGNGKSAIPE